MESEYLEAERQLTMTMTAAVALCGCACVVYGFAPASLSAVKPTAPIFLSAPNLLGQSDELRVTLRITPHEAIRAVVLEVWEAEEDPPAPGAPDQEPQNDGMHGIVRPTALVRGSSEPVDETNGRQQTFTFYWRQRLPPGIYLFVAKVLIGRGITVESRHRLEVV